jgi:CRP/FNR family transcriptional regulator
MGHIQEIVSKVSLFDGLPQEDLEQIVHITYERSFKKGETVFSEGDKGNGFYVVAEGVVKIFKLSLEGKEQILHIFGSGEPIGEVAVFAGRSFPANAVAINDVRLLFIPRNAFVRLIEQTPSLALNMLGILSLRLRQFTVQIEHLTLREVPGRLAAYLLMLSDEKGKASEIDITITKHQLANLLGTVPETLSRILTRMDDQGFVTVNRRKVSIQSRSGLEELAAGMKTLS